MATARDLIRTNTGPQSGMVFSRDYAMSPFTAHGWSRSTNYSTQKIEVTPTNSSLDAFGTTLEFRPAKNADYYGFVCLQIPFTAVTPGSNYTFYRLTDFVGHHVINNISIQHVSNILQRVDGSALNVVYRKNTDFRKRHHWDPMLLGNLSHSDRRWLAAGAQVATVPLDGTLWFTYSTSAFVPVICLSQELRILVTFNPLTQVLESDHTSGTPQCTISPVSIKGQTYNPALVFLSSHITGEERNYQTKFYDADGVMLPVKEYRLQPRQTITAGSTGQIPIKLSSINAQISEIYFIIRRQNDLTNNYAYRPNRTLTYVSCSFMGNGGVMIADHTREYVNQRIREQYHSSLTSENYCIGMLEVSWIPEDPINNTGSIHTGQITDPTLYINIGTQAGDSEAFDVLNGSGPDSTTPENIVVDVFCDAFNWIHFVGGDANRLFN